MPLKPLGTFVLCEPINLETDKKALIVTPDAYKADNVFWRVIALGSGVKAEIPVGARVLSHAYQARWVELPEGKLRLIDEGDILAVIDDERPILESVNYDGPSIC